MRWGAIRSSCRSRRRRPASATERRRRLYTSGMASRGCLARPFPSQAIRRRAMKARSAVLALLVLITISPAREVLGAPRVPTGGEFVPVHARHGMVASSSALASEAGVEIMKEGGNALDAAPSKATATMYQDAAGNVIPGLSTVGYKAIGVPGSVKGLVYAQRHFGKLGLARVMAPAIRLAREGYALSYDDARLMDRDDRLTEFPDSRR